MVTSINVFFFEPVFFSLQRLAVQKFTPNKVTCYYQNEDK